MDASSGLYSRTITELKQESVIVQIGEKMEGDHYYNGSGGGVRGYFEKYRQKRKKTSDGKTVHGVDSVATKFFVYNVFSGLYVSIYCLFPWMYKEDNSGLWMMNIFGFFLTLQASVNWYLVRYTNNTFFLPATRPQPKWSDGRPEEDDFTDIHNGLLKTGHSDVNLDSKTRQAKEILSKLVDWSMCDTCRQPRPPRAHHCSTCDGCILKRDHHCYMAGRCIGFYNQRFFIVLTFYLTFICFSGLYFEYYYLKENYWPTCSTWVDFLLPVAIFKWVVGVMPGHILIMIGHMYTTPWVGFLTAGFCTLQFILLLLGKTSHEFQKRAKVPWVGLQENFRSVFGSWWPINFLFPAHKLFPQTGDGRSWVKPDVIDWYKKHI